MDEKRILELNPELKKRISSVPGGETLLRCFQCGTCTASCPISEIEAEYNPRRFIRKAVLGLDDVLENDFIWLCATCNNCIERCPQGVEVNKVVNAIKNLAIKEGRVLEYIKAVDGLLREHGRLYAVGELEKKKRVRESLPDIIENPGDVKKIMEARE